MTAKTSIVLTSAKDERR